MTPTCSLGSCGEQRAQPAVIEASKWQFHPFRWMVARAGLGFSHRFIEGTFFLNIFDEIIWCKGLSDNG